MVKFPVIPFHRGYVFIELRPIHKFSQHTKKFKAFKVTELPQDILKQNKIPDELVEELVVALTGIDWFKKQNIYAIVIHSAMWNRLSRYQKAKIIQFFRSKSSRVRDSKSTSKILKPITDKKAYEKWLMNPAKLDLIGIDEKGAGSEGFDST